LPPSQLASLGATLADLLLGQSDDLATQASRFTERGLALSSALAAGVALQHELITAGDHAQALHAAARLAQLAAAMNEAEIKLVRQEQEQMRSAVTRALNNQRAESERLTSLLHDLSTPIVPIYDGILVLPLIGAIDSHRASEIMERLLTSISEYQADCVIIDITGVPVVDTSIAQHLLQTAHAASLLGSSAVLVGIGPEIAQTITQLGIELSDVTTLRDLQAGITFALGRRNLAIQQIKRR
jgi:rsbT co-antagonist protein RsbR